MVSGAVGSGAPLSVIWGPPDSSSVSSRSPVCLMRGLGAPSRWQNFLELRHGEVRLFSGPMGVDFSGSRVVASRNTLLHDGATNATWSGRFDLGTVPAGRSRVPGAHLGGSLATPNFGEFQLCEVQEQPPRTVHVQMKYRAVNRKVVAMVASTPTTINVNSVSFFDRLTRRYSDTSAKGMSLMSTNSA